MNELRRIYLDHSAAKTNSVVSLNALSIFHLLRSSSAPFGAGELQSTQSLSRALLADYGLHISPEHVSTLLDELAEASLIFFGCDDEVNA